MMNVSARSARPRRSARQRPVRSALILSSALILPGTAWADCTASGTTVTCSGNSAAYTNTAPNLQVTTDSTAVVVGPLVIGSGTAATGTAPATYATLNVVSGANIEGSTAAPTVQFGDYAQITNNGTITSGSSTSGAAAIQVGINSTVTNNGTLTAVAGTPAVTFTAAPNVSTNGTFINGATAPTAVVGNVLLGYNTGNNVGTFINNFNTTTTATSTATYGLTGNVYGQGNMNIDNEGSWTGSLSETAAISTPASVVTITNGASANFSGTITTGDTTILVNNATGNNAAGVGYAMLLGNGSALGASATNTSSLTNNGVLTIGSTTAPALVTINGSFVQNGTYTQTTAAPGATAAATVTPVLNMAIAATGSVVAGASSQPYSQIYAVGGTAKLGGILNVNVIAGFYPVGSTYNLIVADEGITGHFGNGMPGNGVNVLNASGDTLPFITFVDNGIVTTSGTQQAYQFEVERVGTYATDIKAAGFGTPNQLAVATALNPIVTFAEATGNSATQEATLVGQIDQLTIAQATALFDQMSPAGLLSYASALHDEANNFERAIQLRMQDQNSDHAEDGWWGTANGQVDVSKATVDSSKQSMFGFNLGYDLSGPHHVFGIAGTVTFDSLHNSGSTLTGHNRDFGIAGYGGYDAGPIHLTGQVAYNLGHLSTTRTLTLGTTTDTAYGSAGEHLFKATGSAGFMLHVSDYTFEPFAGIDFMRGKIKGFTETNDGAAALTVLPINADRTDLLAGLSLTRSSGKLRPYLRATYRSEIGNSGADTVSAYFDGNTATAFTVAGVPAAKHEEDVNAGLNWVFEDAGSLYIGYQGTLRSGFSSHGINLGIRLEF